MCMATRRKTARTKKVSRVRTPLKRAARKPVRRTRAPVRKRKPARRVPAKKPKLQIKSSSKTYLGTVLHYYTSIGVGVIQLMGPVKKGEWISLEGATTHFRQKVESIHIEHAAVAEAHAGQAIGIKLRDRVREGDKVFKD